MRARERAAANRRQAAARREAARQRARDIAHDHAEYRRKQRNCAALNGTLRRITYPDGSTSLLCVSPYGFFEPA